VCKQAIYSRFAVGQSAAGLATMHAALVSEFQSGFCKTAWKSQRFHATVMQNAAVLLNEKCPSVRRIYGLTRVWGH
jgi:hypothetical protein